MGFHRRHGSKASPVAPSKIQMNGQPAMMRESPEPPLARRGSLREQRSHMGPPGAKEARTPSVWPALGCEPGLVQHSHPLGDPEPAFPLHPLLGIGNGNRSCPSPCFAGHCFLRIYLPKSCIRSSQGRPGRLPLQRAAHFLFVSWASACLTRSSIFSLHRF